MRIFAWCISTFGLIAYVPQAVADNLAAVTTIYVERVELPVSTESTTSTMAHRTSAARYATSTVVVPSYSTGPTMPVLMKTGGASALTESGVTLVGVAGVLGLMML